MDTVNVIKGYELHERIGSGGFGVVHRATQTTVGREVAIKIILPHFSNHPDFIRRFETEAQIIARLEHLHIVPLYDYWRDPGGAYLVMRWLRGGNLRDVLANGPFELEAAALFMDQMSSALALAHRSGVVHRDLKPANILLDEDGNAYLSDFGIAKDFAQIEGPHTGTGMVLGSPDYLSPEQARSESVAPQTDIYSLGVMLYEVLVGHHPFPNLSSIERLYKHLNDPLPCIDSLPSELIDGVNAIIQKATAKNPAQRYADVLEMAADFRREADLSKRSPESIVEQLTFREQEVLQMITEGLTNKEIAEQLFVTVATVKWHIRQLYQKLHVRSRVQAIMRARDLQLIGADTAIESTPGESTFIALPEPENPYKGLRAFQTVDARDFFGREQLVQQLVHHLDGHDKPSRFLAVVGPSGSGKSSVVKAGLLPALSRGDLPGSERWFVVEMIPGTFPLDELEIALTRVAANQAGNLRDHLERDARGLVRVAGLILPDDGSELVLIVDQFEEVFTLVEDDTRRTQFLNLLTAAVTDARSRVRVIITLRADFYDRPLHYPLFGELVRTQMETVMPLSAEELEAAIVKPAARVGVSFEEGLVATITGDVHYQPGALPLLQYALTELFEQRTNRTLTHSAYQALGGATGALARRAEELYHEQDEIGQETLRQMFLRLVTLGEGVEDTRRRVPRSELLALAHDDDRMDEAIDTYAAYRLLTLDHDPASRRPTVEIAHEAILREWERLRIWLNESRHDIQQQRLLTAAAADWQQANQDKSYLLHGTRLEQLEAWVTDTELALTPHERNFLEICIAERGQQQAAERERQQHEAALKHRAQRVLQLLVGVFLVAAVAGIGLSIFAFDRERQAQDARDSAEREADVNHSLVLGYEAIQRYDSGRADLALALALEAVRIEDPPAEAVRALSSVAQGMGTRAILRAEGNRVTAVAFNADTTRALSGSCATLVGDTCTESELIVWDIESATELRRLEGQTGWITSVAFDPTSPEYALSASDDGTLFLWNVETGELLRRFEGHTGSVNSVVFGADGEAALSGSDDQTVILWEVATGQIMRRFEGHTASVTTVAFSPDGQLVAAGGDSGSTNVFLWQVDTGEVVHRLAGPTARIHNTGFRFDAAGQIRVLAYSYDNAYREWNIETGALIRTVSVSNSDSGMTLTPDGGRALVSEGNGGNLVDIGSWTQLATVFMPSLQLSLSNAISPDGRLALLGSDAGEVILVNLPVSNEVRRFQAEDGLVVIDVSPDGRYLLAGSHGMGTAILWDVQTGQEIRRFEGQEAAVAFVQFSPDGRQALIGSCDCWAGTPAGMVVLTNVETGDVIHEWTGFDFYPRSAAFSPDGHIALVGTMQWGDAWDEIGAGELVVLDLITGQEIRRFEPTVQSLGISYSPDGRRAVTANSLSGPVTLWDVTTGQRIRQFDHTSATVVFTSDLRYFLTGSSGGFVYLVDAETGADIRRFSGSPAIFWTIAISPDQQYLLAGGDQGQLVVWNFETGEEIQDFQGHGPTAATWNVVFSPDGRTAFSSALDAEGDVIEWRIAGWPLDDLLTWVHENRYIRDFTCEERVQYRIEPLCE